MPNGVPRPVDTSNLSSVTPTPCPPLSRNDLKNLSRLLIMYGFLYPHPLFLPLVSLSSAVSHLCGCGSFCSLPWCLKPPGVPFHDRRRLQRRGCTVILTSRQDPDPGPGPAARRPPLWPLLPIPEEPQNSDSLMGFVTPQGFHMAHN